jgi:hypothetical protein
MMTRILAIILVVAFCFGVQCHAGVFASSAETKAFLEKRGMKSKDAAHLRATAFIVNREGDTPEGPLMYLRALSAEEAALNKEQIIQLLKVLENRRTYMPDFIKLCVPSYEVGVTLTSTTSQMEIRFCLMCDMMSIVTESDGLIVHVDRGHNELLEFFQSVFPKNETLRGVIPNEKKELLRAEDAIGWAEDYIPKDTLLKRVKAMKPEEVSDEILEELVNKATDFARGRGRKSPRKKK